MHAYWWMQRLCLMMIIVGCTPQQGKRQQEVVSPLPSQAAIGNEPAVKTKIQASYAQIPLHFEANQGQSDQQVKFLSRGNGYALFLTPTEAVLSLYKRGNGEKGQREKEEDNNSQAAVLRMQLAGANPQSQVEGLEELPGKINYFIGDDPTQWRTNVPTYAKVKYHDVYPGVDLVYYGNQQQLEYDFIVAPGVDPATVTLSFQDHNGQLVPVRVDDNNDLVVRLAEGEIRFRKPLVYQEVNGVRREVAGNYLLRNSQDSAPNASQVGFQVASYDVSKPLIIDPVLEYSSYLGGSGRDVGEGIAVNSDGNAYITGWTFSSNFPLMTPYQMSYGHIFITKVSATGSSLLYSTYLGGSPPSVIGGGNAIAVDAEGHAYVTGVVLGTFPTAPRSGATCLAYQCLCPFGSAFLTKLNPQGNTLSYSTCFGGSITGHSIAVEATKNENDIYNVYIAGEGTTSSIPTKIYQPTTSGGGQDAFVAKFNPAGGGTNDLLYSARLGGSVADIAYGVAVDAEGNAYLTGRTSSTDFPTASAYQSALGSVGQADAFAAKLSASGSTLVYSTYLGGNNADEGESIAVDSTGNAYVTGYTGSQWGSGGLIGFPVVNALQTNYAGGTRDAFLTKITPTGSVVYSSYVGGNRLEVGKGIALDPSGNVYLTGWTQGGFTSLPDNFFDLHPLHACTLNSEAFVIKLNPTASLYAREYATCLGGTNTDQGNAIAVDASGNAYVTGYTHSTNFPTSANFPTVNSSFQPTLGGAGFEDAFVAKISTDSDTDGYSTAQGDCADNNAAVHPNATEVCDSIDNDCNGQVDEGLLTTFYQDLDSDGYGNTNASQQACSQPTGYASNNTDCNDSDAAVHPGAHEGCNGHDDNCNTATDESPTSLMAPLSQSCYSGSSGTAGVGICHSGTQTCLNGTFDSCSGEVTPTTETCNNLDDDCDGSVDEGVQTTFYQDADGDGYGNLTVTTQACTAPSGYVASSTDCDDTNGAIHPGAGELCDGQDNDCNGIVDNGFALGNACSVGVGACQQAGVTVCAANSLDTVCDAGAGTPTAELCGDGIDQDCDGSDETCTGTTYQTSGLCVGAPGHQILQPINADGTSIFKQGATVVAKFRVCDTNGTSVGHPGVVTDFRLMQVVQGVVAQTINETVVSNTADTAFRWDASAQQWIFNIKTKDLTANQTYFYRISLDDGSFIDFRFGLKK